MKRSNAIAEKMAEAAQKMLSTGTELAKQRAEQESDASVDPFKKLDEEIGMNQPAEQSDQYMPTADTLGHMPTHEEFCEAELKKARELNYDEPSFDFRNDYFKGQVLYYAYYSNITMEKRVMQLKARTIYPRFMVLTEEQGPCTCIGYNERGTIFLNAVDARNYLDNVTLVPMTLSGKIKEIYDDKGIFDECADTGA